MFWQLLAIGSLNLLPPAFALLYRCRGGFMGLANSTLARIVYWAIPVAIWAFTVDVYAAPLMGLLAFLGLLIPHSPFQGPPATVNKALAMGGIAMARLALILSPLILTHPWALCAVPVASLSGVGYYLGWSCLADADSGISFPGLTLFGKQIIAPGQFATSGGEWGEVFTGWGFGVAFAIITGAVLYG